MLMSVGFGMIAGLACWVIGIWGKPASLAEAALPPPYSAEFFADRLMQWIGSLQPIVILPFIVIAIGSTILLARATREPARNEDQVSIWWLVAFAGAATVVTGAAIPYYRFMNASAAPMALVGLGAFVAIRWFASDRPASKVATWAGAALIAWAAIAYVLKDSLSENAPVWVFALMGLLGVLVLIRGLARRRCRASWQPGWPLSWCSARSAGCCSTVSRTGGSARRTSGPTRACGRPWPP